MQKFLLDYDPFTGVSVNLEFVQDGASEKMIMTHSQDVTGVLEQAKALANNEDYTRRGIKRDEWHYARIPWVVLQDMKQKHGVDWYDKDDGKHRKFFSVLNAHYPAFKTTSWNHE